MGVIMVMILGLDAFGLIETRDHYNNLYSGNGILLVMGLGS
jgi:hypothetical protein